MIPDFQSILLPLLGFAKDGKEHHIREAIEFLSNKFRLTEEDKKKMLPSGQQRVFESRVGWAKTYLQKAGLLQPTGRGLFKITDEGLKLLENPPPKLTIRYLKEHYPKFREFHQAKTSKKRNKKEETISEIFEKPPEELMAEGYNIIREQLINEILERLKNCSPTFFEKLVVDLLVKMGYGGSVEDAGKAIGGSGDEGIDGVIKEDKLGLDVLYIQAKRWENSVGRPEIQKFVGALYGKQAKKGVFITTSTFTKGAIEYVKKIDSKIILINGRKLAELMIDHNVGVYTSAVYEVKKIDLDYFEE